MKQIALGEKGKGQGPEFQKDVVRMAILGFWMCCAKQFDPSQGSNTICKVIVVVRIKGRGKGYGSGLDRFRVRFRYGSVGLTSTFRFDFADSLQGDGIELDLYWCIGGANPWPFIIT